MLKQAKSILVTTSLMLLASPVCAQGHGANLKDMKFATMPTLPGCATAAVAQGDPSKGASFILAKAGTNCVIPWHWHNANETVMMVSGEARLDIKDGNPITISQGGNALLPSMHIHRFTCLKACTLYVHSDTVFDIHYVNAGGQEIPMDQALKKTP